MTFSQSLLRNTVIGLLFATLLIPFIVSESFFFPFITGKVFTFRILVEIALFLYAMLALSAPQYRPKRTPALAAFTAFIVIIALADMLGANPYKSFWSNYERMEGLVTHLHLYAYVVMLMSVFRDKTWYWFFHTSLGASFFVALYGLIQLSGRAQINQGGVRLDARFGNATYLAVYLLFHIFFCLYYLGRSKNIWARVTYVALMLLELVVLYYTATRGAILGLIVGLFLAAVGYAIWGSGTGRRIATAGIIGIVAFVGAFYAARNTEFVQKSKVLSRFANISRTEQTTESRFIIWDMSLEGFKEKPILGWGQENYNIVFNKNYDPRLWRQEQWFDRAHNVFFDWLIAGGILGLLSYLAIFGAGVWALMRGSRMAVAEKAVLFGLLAGYFFQNVFVFDNLASYMLFYATIGYIAYAAFPEEEQRPLFSSVPASSMVHDVGLAVSGVIFLVAMFYVNIRPMQASAALLNALRYADDGRQSIDYFKKALDYNTYGSVETREQLAQAALRAAENKSFSPEIQSEFIMLGRTEMAAQFEAVPIDARYALFEGILLFRTGAVDEGISYLEKALALSPAKQSIMFELVNAYASKKNYAKALEIAKKAYELDTSYGEAQSVYAVAALYAGDSQLADDILAKTGTAPDTRFIQAYIDLKRYDKVIEIWKARIVAEPTNAQNHVSLAATYLTVGNRTAAIAELREAIRLNPSFKDQGEFYIKEIQAGRNP